MLDRSPKAEFIERTKCINCGSLHLVELSRGNYTDDPLAGFLAADPWGEDPLPYLRNATWLLVKCSHCSQIFHRKILNEEWNERRFSQWMSSDAIRAFEARRGPQFKADFNSAQHHVEHILRIEKMTRHLRGDNPVRLLDFGCGFGSFLEACCHFGFLATGVDRSIGRRSEASVEIYPSLDSLKGQQFHAVTLFEVLEHLDDPAKMLSELSAHVVPDGILVLETPDCTDVTGIRTHRDYLLAHPLEHINAFTHETLKSIAERNGFNHIQRGPAFVSAEPKKIAKRFVKHAIGKDGASTQLYLRKV